MCVKKSALGDSVSVCFLSIIKVLEVLGQESCACVCVGVKKSILDDTVSVCFLSIIQVLEVLGQVICVCV